MGVVEGGGVYKLAMHDGVGATGRFVDRNLFEVLCVRNERRAGVPPPPSYFPCEQIQEYSTTSE